MVYNVIVEVLNIPFLGIKVDQFCKTPLIEALLSN